MSAPPSPSGEGAGARQPPARLILLVLGLLGVRLALAAVLPLTEDEAYYRLWSQAPALGYYDHPPMIAWWIWLGRRLAGDTSLGVRLVPSLGSAAVSFLVLDLAGRLGSSPRTAERSAVWYNATFLVAAGGFLAVPDAPAALFWMLTLCAAMRAWVARSTGWWIAAGLAAGLASLSKYSSLFLGPGMFLWLAASPAGRTRLRTPGPWLALAAAVAVFGLNIAWNAAHHWLTFAKQFGRIAPHRLEPRFLAEFLLAQILLLNPLIAAFVVRALADRSLRARLSLLVATGLPFVAYLTVHALHDRVQAHWPAPLYPPAAIIAAAGAQDLRGAWAKLRPAAVALGFGGCLAALAYLALPLLGVPLAFDPGAPLRGWPAFATQVEQARARAGAAWIGTTSYGLAAQLLDQPHVRAPVMQVSERDRWLGLHAPRADTSAPGLIVDLARRVNPILLQRCFVQVRPLGDLVRAAPGERGKTYALVVVSAPRRDVARVGCGF